METQAGLEVLLGFRLIYGNNKFEKELMSHLTQKELALFSNKILDDYDSKNPSIIFKDNIKITNEDGLIIQSNVARLRENRGEEIIGYKIGCISKDTQKKWDLFNLLVVIYGKVSCTQVVLS